MIFDIFKQHLALLRATTQLQDFVSPHEAMVVPVFSGSERPHKTAEMVFESLAAGGKATMLPLTWVGVFTCGEARRSMDNNCHDCFIF